MQAQKTQKFLLKKQFYKDYTNGFVLVLLVSFASYYVSALPVVQSLHLSPLILSVLLGILAAPLFRVAQNSCEKAVVFSAKKLLRLGIILFGFNVTLSSIVSVGLNGILLSIVVVGVILVLGYVVGVKFLKLDREIAILVSGGSAICGAAAVLALESSIKSKPYKGVIAVGMVVLFGLLGMFLYPLVYAVGILPFSQAEMGYFIGLTLHELANVVGAGGAISHQTQEIALIVKMIRVILLVAVLLIVPYFFMQEKEGNCKRLHIPWFAFWFLGVVIVHSFVQLPEKIVEVLRFLSNFSLVMAMSALGLQVDFKKLLECGRKAFVLALILFGILTFGGFLLVYYGV
ncbi:YeiH family protein [Helicobacter sp.]|uniref:YeiH family protein n=1 Tax=Helicobacter sp. TaxID=218 RepID=UPI0025BD584E|nr:YeiH family protein [Helicobacter sp.]MCI5968653.1 YeiH family protein [Helicobacter sp.]MDY2584475.1 YeiH family protein [Helicobacter sp.]